MISLKTLLKELALREVRVWLEGNELMVEGPEHALDAELQDRLTRSKDRLIDFLQQEAQNETFPGGSFPLSYAQLCFWFVYFMMGETANNLSRLIIHGQVQAALLERCINTIIAANHSLRVSMGSFIPRQKIRAMAPYSLPFADLRHLDSADQERFVQQRVTELMAPFDLSKPPLLRCYLLQLKDDESLLLSSFAHIVLDGGGLYLFERQLIGQYQDALNGVERAAPGPLQIATAVARERYQARYQFNRQQAFWKQCLEGYGRTTWPPAYLAEKNQSMHFDRNVPVADDILQALHGLCVQARCSIQMLFVAVVAHAVSRVTGQRRVLLNSVLENRIGEGRHSLLAPCLYQLPVPLCLSEDGRLQDLIEQVKKHNLQALEHMDIPFSVPQGLIARQRWRGKNRYLASAIMGMSRLLARITPVADLYPSYWADYLYTVNPPLPDPLLSADYRHKKVVDPIVNVNMLHSFYKPQHQQERQAMEVLADKHRFLPTDPLDGEWEDETINFYIVADDKEGAMFRITCSCLSSSGMDRLEHQLRLSLTELLGAPINSEDSKGDV